MATHDPVERLIHSIKGFAEWVSIINAAEAPLVGERESLSDLLRPALSSLRQLEHNKAGTYDMRTDRHAREATAHCVALCIEASTYKNRALYRDVDRAAWVELATALGYLAVHCLDHRLLLHKPFLSEGAGPLMAVVKRLCDAPATISQQPWGVAYFAVLLGRLSSRCSDAELTDGQWRWLVQGTCAATPLVKRFMGPPPAPGPAGAQQPPLHGDDGFGAPCTCVVQRDGACGVQLPALDLFGYWVVVAQTDDEQSGAPLVSIFNLGSAVCRHTNPIHTAAGSSPPIMTTAGRAIVANLAQHGFQQLSIMAVALAVHSARQAEPPVAAKDGGRVDLARFLDPSLLVALSPMLREAYMMHVRTWVANALCTSEVCPVGGLCAGCLPDQLLLLLEAAALVGGSPMDMYERMTRLWLRLATVPALHAALSEFRASAPAAIAARVLQALRDEARAPRGSAAAMDAAMVGNLLVRELGDAATECRWRGDTVCDAPGSLASMDMLIEACTRASCGTSGISSVLLLDSRMLYLGTVPFSWWQGAWAACAPAGAIVSTGKFLMRGGVLAPQPQHGGSTLRASTVSEVERAYSVLSMVAGRVGSLPASAGCEAAALTLLFASRVGGAAAMRLLREVQDGAVVGRDTTRSLEAIVASLQRPLLADLLWDAGVEPPVGHGAPSIAGSSHEAAAGGMDDSAADAASASSTHNGNSSGVNAAALEPVRFLAELFDRLDATALGVRLSGCYNPRCTNLSGAREADLPVHPCSARCGVACYCSDACETEHWHWHEAACDGACVRRINSDTPALLLCLPRSLRLLEPAPVVL